MLKLNQIVAVVNGKKTEAQKGLTEVYRKCGVPDLFSGLSRTYRPKNDGDETLPSEGKQVQYTVSEALKEFQEVLGNLVDVVATQDFANGDAKADIVVDGAVIVEKVPVTYLLFLEKQLVDLHTFVSKLPVLDSGETWTFDPNKDLYTSGLSVTNRTKKITQSKVLYEATKEHPAQISQWTEDVNVGTWNIVKFSGAMPVKQRKELVDKVKKLQDAVKFAREQANQLEISQVKVSDKIFSYLFS
jgi:hypothetical protein